MARVESLKSGVSATTVLNKILNRSKRYVSFDYEELPVLPLNWKIVNNDFDIRRMGSSKRFFTLQSYVCHYLLYYKDQKLIDTKHSSKGKQPYKYGLHHVKTILQHFVDDKLSENQLGCIFDVDESSGAMTVYNPKDALDDGVLKRAFGIEHDKSMDDPFPIREGAADKSKAFKERARYLRKSLIRTQQPLVSWCVKMKRIFSYRSMASQF